MIMDASSSSSSSSTTKDKEISVGMVENHHHHPVVDNNNNDVDDDDDGHPTTTKSSKEEHSVDITANDVLSDIHGSLMKILHLCGTIDNMMTTTNTTTTTNLGDSTTTTSELGGGGKVIRMAGVSDYLVRIIKQLNRLRSEGEVLRLLKSTTTSSSPENNDTPPTPPTSSSSSLVVPEDVLSAIFRSAESGSYEHLKSTVNEHITDLRNSRDRFEEQQTLLCEFKKELISSCCGIEFVDDKQNEKEEVKEEEKGKSITTQ